jgi:hypothetical protein
VDTRQVCIWIACSRPVIVRAEIFRFSDLDPSAAKKAPPIGSGVTKSIQLGQHLHVALVTAHCQHEPNATSATLFPTDTLLAYDIEIKATEDDNTKGKRLADLGLSSGKDSITYIEDIPFPTFFIKGDGSPLNVLHGSCRKLHGKGEDCLAAADEVIASSFMDLNTRPCALFLTGDQIYADDVAIPLARYLTEYGIYLLGWEERIEGIDKKISEIVPGTRQDLIKKYAGFTSGQAENHLLAFGEFVAMYMLAWNAENWPDSFPDARSISGTKQSKYNNQIEHLKEAKRDLAGVRRTLANVPTYMIFDDHDVTDDWNITREWQEKVRTSKCGGQIIANALMAFWVFQGWGNDSSLYDSDFIDRITEYLNKKGDAEPYEKRSFEDFICNFHRWTFSAPTTPLTVFADTRTQRQYDSFNGPPQLINADGLLAISNAAYLAGYKKGDPIIIVSAVPVVGFYLFEILQKALAMAISTYALDLETWYANTTGRTNFLLFLREQLSPQHCIFMSGDVHFGFTTRAAITFLQKNQASSINTTQLTSSALKTTSLVKIAFISDILGRVRQLFPFKRIVRTGLTKAMTNKSELQNISWMEARQIVRASGSVLSPLVISDNNLGLVTITRKSSITHKLIVRKGIVDRRVYEAVVSTDKRSPLEESRRVKISERLKKS